ncbi:hypothetical protein J421_3725 [Gemmatirosa kalamazoonensis]|uniref:4-vinyl reductase 4VR domain-containing protein n=1 Tax=Gemmatirosa kalamazoonensis TaxID=861299 RepID=W0RLF2_9BACT|nr:hypothetical protein [Gemmatirosa kalamazoonensis]AHG91262.1 hypothetical protein J421_3725 [Gemmatirosa kalamazoonensis]
MTVAELVAKGSTIRATLEFVSSTRGEAARREVLTRLSDADRALVESLSATDEVPFALWLRVSEATDAVVGPAVPDWPERAGALAIESLGVQLYGGILRKSSPLAFATQSVSLFRLYYHPGDMKVVETESIGDRGGRVVLRLVGFDHTSRHFCRRQTGGLAKAVEIAGGERARVRHVRCALEGDAFCEWDLKWE